MDVKDKIIITCIILFVVIFGIKITSFADANLKDGECKLDVSNTNGNFIDELSKYAISNKEGFFKLNVDEILKMEFQSYHDVIGDQQYKYFIATPQYRSGICLYHIQPYHATEKYQILPYNIIDILDFDFDKKFIFKQNGIQDENLNLQDKLDDLATIADKIYCAQVGQEKDFCSTNYKYMPKKRELARAVYHSIGNNSIKPSNNNFYTGSSGAYLQTYTTGSFSSDYGQIISDFSSVEKMETDSIELHHESNGDTIMGPFKLKFSGKKISSIKISSDKKVWEVNNINNESIDYFFVGGSCRKDLSGIPSDANIWIKVSDSLKEFYDGNNLQVTFYQEGITTYKARLMLALTKGGNGQNLGIFAAEQKNYIGECTYDIKKTKANLTIVKYGNDIAKGNEQAGVNFILSNQSGKYAYDGSNGEIEFKEWNDKNGYPKIWTTDSDGKITIEGLYTNIEYKLRETWNENIGYRGINIKGATLLNGEASINLSKDGNEVAGNNIIGGIILSDSNENILNVIDSKDESHSSDNFYIRITKKDDISNTFSGNNIGGAEFKIKVLDQTTYEPIGWLKYDSGNYTYSGVSFGDSTTWSSSIGVDSNNNIYAENKGVILIENLNKNYKYEIYETKTPAGYYDLQGQVGLGMDVKINDKILERTKDFMYVQSSASEDKFANTNSAIKCGTVSYSMYSNGVDMVVTNASDSPSTNNVDISGRVWIDQKGTKTGEYNNQYDAGEELADVKVYLKRTSDNTIVKYNGKDCVETDSSGIYTFYGKYTGITSSKLSKYYIEIEYEGIGSQYNIVKYGTGDNQSKAKYTATGSAWTDSINSSYNLHMNIGIFYDPSKNSESITKNIAYIKTNIKGTEYKYKYGTQNKNMPFTVEVGNAGYYRTIYASDIIYSKQDNITEGLEVYITYAITVKNESLIHSSRYPNYEKSYAYPHGNLDEEHERFMKVNLYDEYDATYYKLVEKNEDETWQNGSWSVENGKAKYSLELSFENATKNPNNSQTIYVTYQLTSNAFDEIYKRGFTSSKRAYIEGKHYLAKYEIYEEDWDWTGPKYKKTWTHIKDYYAWFDSDNPNPNSTNHEKYESSINGGTGIRYSNTPPGLRFSIYEKDEGNNSKVAERTITGTVFEDSITDESKNACEVVGNGLFDQTASDSENRIQNVKVELLEKDKTTLAKIYRLKTNADGTFYVNKNGEYEIETYTDESGNIRTGKPATTTTDSKGHYEFKGIIPR